MTLVACGGCNDGALILVMRHRILCGTESRCKGYWEQGLMDVMAKQQRCSLGYKPTERV